MAAVAQHSDAQMAHISLEADRFAPVLDIPQDELAGLGAREGMTAVGEERHAPHGNLWTFDASNLPKSVEVPEGHGPVETTGQGAMAIGRESHAQDFGGPIERFEFFPLVAPEVPEPHRLVVAPRKRVKAHGREGHGLDGSVMLDPVDLAPGREIPQADGAIAAGREDAKSIG